MPTLNAPAASRFGDLAGGITTFFTMAYIVVVNPSILSTPGTGIPFSGAPTATVLIASITQGILWGFILHTLLYLVTGRRREVSATLWVLATISAALLVLESQR